MWKRGLLITALVLGTAMAYRIFGVYELRSGECSARPSATMANSFPRTLRVMTFNIEGHASLLRDDHIERVAETIRKYQPDVVAINEAHRNTWQSRFDDHTKHLERLTGMTVLFGRSYRFLGGDFGNAILTRGAVLSSEVHRLPGIGEPRTLLEAVLRVNGGTIAFFVAHTAAWGPIGTTARREQLGCIATHLRSSAYPFVLAGDLNASPGSPEMMSFLQNSPVQFTGDPETATHRVTGQRLDYILAGPGWIPGSSQVLEDGPSDHRPVLSEFTHP